MRDFEYEYFCFLLQRSHLESQISSGAANDYAGAPVDFVWLDPNGAYWFVVDIGAGDASGGFPARCTGKGRATKLLVGSTILVEQSYIRPHSLLTL